MITPTPAAVIKRFSGTASTSSPAGTWPAIAAIEPRLSTNPMSVGCQPLAVDEGAKARQHVRDEEVQPIQTSQATPLQLACLSLIRFRKSHRDGGERRIALKALKARIRSKPAAAGDPVCRRLSKVTPYLVGWRGYFGFCQTPSQTPFDDFPSRGTRFGLR